MALSVNTNVAAMNAYRNLSGTQGSLGSSLEKLSSGFRINRAADDAAGLAISEGMRSQIGGMKQAARNAQDGISLVQTAEGALQETHAILQRMRDLSVQAANDTNNADARNNITTEMKQLQQELGRIAESTTFNGKQLLDGTAGVFNFQVGANGDDSSRIVVDLVGANVAGVAERLETGGGATFEVLTPTDVTGDMVFEADVNGSTVTATVTLTAAGDYKTVGDVARALNADAGFAASFSASVDKDNQLVVKSKQGGTVDTATAPGTGVDNGAAVAGGLNVGTHVGAREAIDAIDAEIATISTARANLGAYQNRFDHTIKNLNVAVENLSASESRIRDTDMAQEMMSFTRSQILSQAGTAMLAQANQIPQGVLQLLR